MAKVLLPKNSSRNGDVITIGLCINLGFQRQEAFSDPNGTSWRSIASSVEAGDKFAGTLSPTDKRQTRETRICIGQNLTTRGGVDRVDGQLAEWWRLAKSSQFR